MRKHYLAIATLLSTMSVALYAQKNDKELFSINEKPITVSEFKRVYEKNLGLVVDKDSKDIDNYLNLYINYKLKVNEAYAVGLDTLQAYKRELEGYKNQLITPYLQDESTIERLIKEAYDRTKNEVRASHLLIKINKKDTAKDTLQAYTKIMEARGRILKGEEFEVVARELSDDPSAKINGGDLGYFSAFNMVYNFEDKAYNTPVGEVSMPFKTRFGYHIIKVTGKRPSKGEFEAAHILVRDKTIEGKVKIDSVYQKIKSGASFEDMAKNYSEDSGTATLGGKLPKFGTGRMVEEFENTVLSLKELNDLSEPFKTRFGWHIVKLLNKYPIGTFEEMKSDLENKVKRSDRLQASYDAVLNKLKKEYSIKVNEAVFKKLKQAPFDELIASKGETWLLTINNEKTTEKEFIDFIKFRKNPNVPELFEQFKNQKLLEFFKADLINREPDYKNTLTEYQEGLLLFELMQQKIWKRSAEDTLGLQKFFDSKKAKYAPKKLEEIKGQVMSDYQQELEDNWIKELREKNVIEIKERELKKLKKTYNQ